MKRKVGIIDEEVGSIRVLAKINRMQAFYRRGELDHPRFSEDLIYAPAVGTIVCDLEFLSQSPWNQNTQVCRQNPLLGSSPMYPCCNELE